jgi:hypothetical protein
MDHRYFMNEMGVSDVSELLGKNLTGYVDRNKRLKKVAAPVAE